METGYDASSTVGNQSVETRESIQPEMPGLDQQIYQQQPQHQQHALQQRMQNHCEMEIPAAKVNTAYNYLTA